MISYLHAAILGFVEGLTEFLPVSSTGHLILTSHWLGLGYGDGVKAFEVVIQIGALLAVVSLYFPSVRSMALGLIGRDRDGLRLFSQLMAGFMPAAVIGLLADDWIKERLFGAWPVVIALAVGGAAMLLIDRYQTRTGKGGRELGTMTLGMAFAIGCAQCLAMWPGTSRSMVTIVAAMLLGFSARDAARFSFLLALPTLGAASAYDLLKHHEAIMHVSGPAGLAVGFAVSFVVAWLAVKGFVAFLNRHGMSLFGWYRLALAALMAFALLSQVTLTGTVGKGAAPAIAVLETPQGGAHAIYANAVGAELAGMIGRKVRVSGSPLDGSVGSGTIKVLNYQVLEPQPD